LTAFPWKPQYLDRPASTISLSSCFCVSDIRAPSKIDNVTECDLKRSLGGVHYCFILSLFSSL
jgi:hypothetical protein